MTWPEADHLAREAATPEELAEMGRLVAEFRRFRDLPTIALERLEREWTAAGRRWSTSETDPEFWQVATAATNRWPAARHRGAPVITDAEETARIVAAVRAPGTSNEELFVLVAS